jgi:alkylated DNA repair dioxygenase AlkB
VLAFQGSLIDGGEPAIDLDFAGLTRVQLDDTSWVDHAPGWLGGSDSLFEHLLAIGAWQQRERHMYDGKVLEPRLTAGFSADASDATMPPVLAQIAAALSERYEVDFDRIWVNLYRDGQDSVAWHPDRNGKVHRNPLVATVSLGDRRRFLLRPKGGGVSHRFEPGHGDLIVMGGACQHDWEHTVPKTTKRVGPRMSVTIRHSRGQSLKGDGEATFR